MIQKLTKREIEKIDRIVGLMRSLAKEYDELPLSLREEVAHDVLDRDLGGQLVIIAARIRETTGTADWDAYYYEPKEVTK